MSRELIHAFRQSPGGYHKGWGGPEYTDWKDEQMSWKTNCYVGDWNFLWTLLFEGPDALKLLSDISVNSFAKFDVGQGKHVVQCNEYGLVIAEGVLMRLDEQKYVAQSTPAFYVGYKIATGDYNARSWQEDWYKYQVQGPLSLFVLEKAAGESLRDIGFMRFRHVEIAGHKVLCLRQGMAGDLGYEIQGPAGEADDVYNAVLDAGKEFGIRRLGRRTVMINHIEACFPTAVFHYQGATFGRGMEGYQEFMMKNFDLSWVVPKIAGSFEAKDISEYCHTPVEMGWAKNIKFDHDFIGRRALEAEVANPKRTICTLEFNAEDVIDIYASLFTPGQEYDFMDIPLPSRWILWHDQVLKDGKPAGISTVPGYSYYFRKFISLTYIDAALNNPGMEVNVVWGNPGTPQKLIRATVAPAPYKKDNRRVDVTTLPSYLK
ncbi:MAG: aminomethyl transferase family protein [Syntrophorhabdales bacterium]|jgi:vanillate/3-O-methylgallate O-demethylase